jgi:hypothetical protein
MSSIPQVATTLQTALGPDLEPIGRRTGLIPRLRKVSAEILLKMLVSREAVRPRLGAGVHFTIRLEEGRQCILVLMGATAEGKRELIAVADGYRESEPSSSNVAIRLSGGTKPGPTGSVVARTDSRTAFLGGPSFQDGGGSTWAWACRPTRRMANAATAAARPSR